MSNMPITKTLETERLILRPFGMDDAEAMFQNWISNPEVLRYMAFEACGTLEAARSHIKQWIGYFNDLEEGSSWCIFAIELKSCKSIIGTIDFHEDNNKVRAAEIGYMLGSKWWGNGYATEALRVLIEFCFKEVGLKRLWANHDSRNPASGRVLSKAGMKYEGTFVKSMIRKGELADSVYYAILAEDFFKLSGKGI
ncbi:MAG: GNAT family N-acetyltransferase [Lachnospiraceae bacterium]|nr:GNAT family N-acetyltransferase [Lachnospiraceae bacterium]